MEGKVSIGILGTGDIVWKAYMPMLVKWPTVEIQGIYSRTKKTADKIGSHFGVEFRTNELKALIDRGLQAAFILTHPDSHFDLARDLLLAGVDVFVEKPATGSSLQTRELAELADQKKRILMVGFNRRYAPFYKQAKEIFGNRIIRQCIIEKHRPGTESRDLFQTYIDDTVHQIDLLRFFCGDVEPIQTFYTMEEDVFRSAVSVCRVDPSGIGLIQTSRQAGMWQERVNLHGENLTVEVSAFREIRVKHKDHEEVYGSERPGIWKPQLEERGFQGEVEHFFKCVNSRERPITDGYDSVKTQELLEALVEMGTAY